jgi:hypothetical protein
MLPRLRPGVVALVTLASVALGCGGGGSGNLFVVVFQLGGSVTGNEAAANHQVLISLFSGPANTLESPLTVDVTSTDVTATVGLDYTALNTTVTLPAGSLLGDTFPVDLEILADALIEGNEVAPATHTVTIRENPPPPALAPPASGSIDLESDTRAAVADAAYLVALAFDVEHGLLFGVEVESAGARLVEIDTITGRVDVLGELEGTSELSALAFDAGRRTLYAADATLNALVVVDAETGEASHRGSFGPDTQGVIEGLAFDPTTASLFGILDATDDGTPDHLVVIDAETGAATPVGAGLGLDAGLAPLGLGYDGVTDAFFLSDEAGRLYQVDKETGVALAR